jgi:hypothetical protein
VSRSRTVVMVPCFLFCGVRPTEPTPVEKCQSSHETCGHQEAGGYHMCSVSSNIALPTGGYSRNPFDRNVKATRHNFSPLYCVRWGYIVAFMKVLTMSQIYHT